MVAHDRTGHIMQTLAELESFLRSLGPETHISIRTTKARIGVEIYGPWNDAADDWEVVADSSARTLIEALLMAKASWDAKLPKGVRALLPPKKKKLSTIARPAKD
jgi:hypothetical protein